MVFVQQQRAALGAQGGVDTGVPIDGIGLVVPPGKHRLGAQGLGQPENAGGRVPVQHDQARRRLARQGAQVGV